MKTERIDPATIEGVCLACKKPHDAWTMYEHPFGWRVKGLVHKQWVFFNCPHCGYQTSWDKLGVPREDK